MKIEMNRTPNCFLDQQMYGFDWKEYVLAIPAPLVVVSTYKSDGKTNATMQSWITFANGDGFYCIFGEVNKQKHMYATLRERGGCVINFPSADIYMKCYNTIKHNRQEDDEIRMADLTAEPASMVDAPRIKECFLNLECEYVWEKELKPGANSVVMCVKVINVIMEEAFMDENKQGRYGDTGYLYNVHSPTNPLTGEVSETYVATLKKFATNEELEKMENNPIC